MHWPQKAARYWVSSGKTVKTRRTEGIILLLGKGLCADTPESCRQSRPLYFKEDIQEFREVQRNGHGIKQLLYEVIQKGWDFLTAEVA